MKLVISAKAKQELQTAAAWYEDQTKGLATEFLRFYRVHDPKLPSWRACTSIAIRTTGLNINNQN